MDRTTLVLTQILPWAIVVFGLATILVGVLIVIKLFSKETSDIIDSVFVAAIFGSIGVSSLCIGYVLFNTHVKLIFDTTITI